MGTAIVVAIAEPSSAAPTLTLAAEAARVSGLPLVVGGVARTSELAIGDAIGAWNALPADVDELERRVRRDLDGLTASVRGVACRTDAIVAESVAAGVEALAVRNDAAALVLGASVHGPLARTLLGDHATAIVRDAPCPVVIAPEHPTVPSATEQLTSRPVGVAWDRSGEAAEALAAAAQAAARLGTELRVIHVLEPEAELVLPPHDPKIGAELVASRRADAIAEIRKATADLEVLVSVDVRSGSVHGALRDASSGLGALFVGSRREGALRRATFGSVSSALLHHAHCPLVVVPRGSTVPAGNA